MTQSSVCLWRWLCIVTKWYILQHTWKCLNMWKGSALLGTRFCNFQHPTLTLLPQTSHWRPAQGWIFIPIPTVHQQSIYGAGRLLTVGPTVSNGEGMHSWPQFCGNTITANSIPSVLPLFLVPSPQYYRHVRPHYRGKPADTTVFPQSPLPCSPLLPTSWMIDGAI